MAITDKKLNYDLIRSIKPHVTLLNHFIIFILIIYGYDKKH